MAGTLLKGLAAFKAEKTRQQEEQEARQRPKAEYFNWKHNKNKESKDVVYVRFLQEFADSVSTYREDRGLPIRSVEHQAPGMQGYLRRANCTQESEGRCYACERHAADRAEARQEGRKELKGWGPKYNFYTWVLVDYADGAGPKPVVLSRSFGSTFVDDLIVEVEEDENNQITDKMWKITRTGTGKSTSWKIRKASNVELLDDSDVEVPDLEESVLRAIPYEQQAEYYGSVYKEGDPLDRDEPAEEAIKKPEPSGEFAW